MGNEYLPTKRNLIILKDSLKLSKQGQGLLEQKKLVLLREMQKHKDESDNLREKLNELFKEAYYLLDIANVDIGIEEMIDISNSLPVDNSIDVQYKSMMGVEIPSIVYENKILDISYGLYNTSINIDRCLMKFQEIKEVLFKLAELENISNKLNSSIEKVQRRSNALKDIIIPRSEKAIHDMQNTLEEREREEITRLKVIKKSKEL